MTKALFKKQLMEVFSWLYKDRKTGKIRDVKGIAVYVLLYLFLFGFLGTAFYAVADMLCAPLLSVGMGWFYWCLTGLISIFLGVFGSVFNTYSSLYGAKDNDFLLSLPIPTSQIILVRLFGVYTMGLVYELIVMVPTMVVWFIKAPFSIIGYICVILIPFILSFFVLVLSAILGWVVALIAGKLKHKNIITVFISLAFIAVYYYVYGKAYQMLQILLVNAQEVGNKFKTALYPLYQMGLAAEGNILSMLIFTAVIGLSVLIVYAVLSRSFLGLATSNKGSAKAKFKGQNQKVKSVGGALLQKEFRRFLGSSNYMLNCGLGILFMPLAAVMLVWKADVIREIISAPFLQKYIPLVALAGIAVIATMNDITSPSVSLEGKNIWLVQSLPVSSKQVLTAKLKLHLLLTVIPAIPLIIVAEWLIKPNLVFAVLIPAVALLFILLMAVLGLAVNIKMPNLNWTSEIVPIKQSLSVTVALFGGWVIVGIFALGYYFTRNIFTVPVFMLLVGVILLATSLALLRWVFTKGTKIFGSL